MFAYDLPTPTPTARATRHATPTATRTTHRDADRRLGGLREPQQVILLPPAGTVDVVFDYHNAPPSTDLSATLTGAAVFQRTASRK